MAEPKTALEPLTLREVAFEQYEEFSESILEQSRLTPEQQLALGDQLRGSVERRDRLGNCLEWLDAQAELLRTKEKQLAERRHGFEKLCNILTSALHQQMLDLGIRKVEGLEFSFTVKKNPPHVEIFDEENIPAEFVSYTKTIDRQRIKDSLERGETVPGAALIAGTRLEVK